MLKVHSPYDGKLLREVPLQSVEDVQACIVSARTLFLDKSQKLESYERKAILEKTVEVMKGQVDALTDLCASEGGKPYKDSKVEVLRAINSVEIAVSAMASPEGHQVAMGHTASSAGRIAYTMKEPIGVVASISAFNHPLNLAVHQVIPAIAVGCPVIIKPASHTPLSAMRLVEILQEAGLPVGWAQAVVCGREAGELLATSPDINFLSFIGSGAVGWHLRSKVAPGTRVALEHGGVAPVVVEPDADIDELIPALGKGGLYHAGQVCVSVQRVYIHESICDEVVEKLCVYAKSQVVGDQMDPATDIGPLISHKEVDRVDAWVKEAIAAGAKLCTGGTKISDSCYQPTILLDPPEDVQVSCKEVFGPVICLYTYSDIEEAFDRANSLDVSFQAAIFTKNLDTALLAVKRLNGTTVLVNEHTAFRVDWMPFGGAKASGLGMGGIIDSMEEMCNTKMMIIKSPSL